MGFWPLTLSRCVRNLCLENPFILFVFHQISERNTNFQLTFCVLCEELMGKETAVTDLVQAEATRMGLASSRLKRAPECYGPSVFVIYPRFKCPGVSPLERLVWNCIVITEREQRVRLSPGRNIFLWESHYKETLQWRANFLKAPDKRYLCKTLICHQSLRKLVGYFVQDYFSRLLPRPSWIALTIPPSEEVCGLQNKELLVVADG